MDPRVQQIIDAWMTLPEEEIDAIVATVAEHERHVTPVHISTHGENIPPSVMSAIVSLCQQMNTSNWQHPEKGRQDTFGIMVDNYSVMIRRPAGRDELIEAAARETMYTREREQKRAKAEREAAEHNEEPFVVVSKEEVA